MILADVNSYFLLFPVAQHFLSFIFWSILKYVHISFYPLILNFHPRWWFASDIKRLNICFIIIQQKRIHQTIEVKGYSIINQVCSHVGSWVTQQYFCSSGVSTTGCRTPSFGRIGSCKKIVKSFSLNYRLMGNLFFKSFRSIAYITSVTFNITHLKKKMKLFKWCRETKILNKRTVLPGAYTVNSVRELYEGYLLHHCHNNSISVCFRQLNLLQWMAINLLPPTSHSMAY